MVSQDQILEAQALKEKYGTWAAASRASGIPTRTLQNRAKRQVEGQIPKEKFETTEKQNETTIWSVGTAVRTVEDAIAKAEIDLRLWEIIEKTINSWPTTMKIGLDDYKTVYNWQIKIKLRRRAPTIIQEGIKLLLKDETRLQLDTQTRTEFKNPHMLELSLFDHHFGKLSWARSLGNSWDLEIAENVFCKAVDNLLHKVKGFDIDKILFPIGNDFFQVNNWDGTTAKGTVVESVDDRMPKVFRAGCRCIAWAIERCRDIADVEIVWVPGNHDPETSWYLVEWLSAKFHGDGHVTFNNSLQARKYIIYGVNLLGLTHGNEEKHDQLPLIMASECPFWSEAKCREIHLGHFHKAKEMRFVPLDEFNGCRVRILPSLTGTDEWHYKKGYVKNTRAAEAHLWSKNGGYIGNFTCSI